MKEGREETWYRMYKAGYYPIEAAYEEHAAAATIEASAEIQESMFASLAATFGHDQPRPGLALTIPRCARHIRTLHVSFRRDYKYL